MIRASSSSVIEGRSSTATPLADCSFSTPALSRLSQTSMRICEFQISDLRFWIADFGFWIIAKLQISNNLKSGFSIFHFQSSILNSQFSILNSRFSNFALYSSANDDSIEALNDVSFECDAPSL